MFYKQFLRITDILDDQFVDKFDFWLTTLSARESKTISISAISSRFNVKYGVAKALIEFAEKEGILKKRYVVFCKNEDCEFYYKDFDAGELVKVIGEKVYCHNCNCEFEISYENTSIVYSKEKEPNIPEEIIEKEIANRMRKFGLESTYGNFMRADSLGNNINEIYKLYYNPDESAYNELEQLKKALNGPFKNSKEKGDALEKMALFLFKQIRNISGTTQITTNTNQFDCTLRFPESSNSFPAVLKYMSPYFIVECKNEIDSKGKGKKPSNTYFHKLSDIMSSNEAELGIIFSRGKPSKEDMQIARDNYLLCRNSNHQKILISISDEDLEMLVEKRTNLLKYICYKIDVVTSGAKNASYAMFEKG